MKFFKILLVAISLMSIAASASARPGGHYRHSRLSIGIAIPPLYIHYGGQYNYGASYYPYDYSWRYYPGTVITPTISYVTPVVQTRNIVYTDSNTTYGPDYLNDNSIINQANPSPQATEGKDWLYCHQPDGFYPAIKACPAGWQRVPAQRR